jgi:hypothetical protein
MVDERFELLSLVFRLAGRREYSDIFTAYQQRLFLRFARYRHHPAVSFAAALPLGYDAVFNFAVHIKKDRFGFFSITNIESLIRDGRWTIESAEAFIPLLNDFYAITSFARFYYTNMQFYESETLIFIEDVYSRVNFEWYKTYINPLAMRAIYTPSITIFNYGAIIYMNGENIIVYALLSSCGTAIIHEFCHSFTSPLAELWYYENERFRELSHASIDWEKLPHYATGKIMAMEYLTRAYTILYKVEHERALLPLLLQEKANGFPYIEEVYALITPHEAVGRTREEVLYAVLGPGHSIGEEAVLDFRGTATPYVHIHAPNIRLFDFVQSEMGNVFDTEEGDVLYLEDSYLLIDLGPIRFHGQRNLRAYSRVPLLETYSSPHL